MAILIISTCSKKFSEVEFVRPIEQILKKNGIEYFTKHYSNLFEEDLGEADKIIICGTALQDFKYLNELNKFDWLDKIKKPILGICAGFQIIGERFGCEVFDKAIIGQQEVKTTGQDDLTDEEEFYSYYLNNKSVKLNNDFEVLARGKEFLGLVKHKSKRVWGTLFHPEVMNSGIIVNFCRL